MLYALAFYRERGEISAATAAAAAAAGDGGEMSFSIFGSNVIVSLSFFFVAKF